VYKRKKMTFKPLANRGDVKSRRPLLLPYTSMDDSTQPGSALATCIPLEHQAAKAIERSNAAKVLRRFAKLLESHGYSRRSVWFARERDHLIFFLHVHKFTFGPSFRLHAGVRVLNDPSENVCLNGICTDTALRFKEHLEYDTTDASWDNCALQMERYVVEVAEPWFDQMTVTTLLAAEHPLTAIGRESLRLALNGESHLPRVLFSRRSLGLA
jgi:hypothetical protein